jgi:hypothetical protein
LVKYFENTANSLSRIETNLLSCRQTTTVVTIANKREANNKTERTRVDKTNHINHQRKMKVILFYGFLIAAAPFFSGCSSSLKLSSTWQQGDIVIDGSSMEWQRGLYYDKESDIVYGIRNDDDYVYLCLKTQNRTTQMQIMKAGFTVWFDANDGNDHSFGIRYPLARQDVHSEFGPESDDEQMHSTIEQALLELEIVGAQKEDVQRFSTLDVLGIQAKIGRSQETLAYELRVPLRKTPHTPFAIGVTSTNRISIGLETKEFNRDKIRMGTHQNERLSESKPGDSQMEAEEHEGHGYNDDSRRGGVRENKVKPKQLGLWLSVQLAHSPETEQNKKD